MISFCWKMLQYLNGFLKELYEVNVSETFYYSKNTSS